MTTAPQVGSPRPQTSAGTLRARLSSATASTPAFDFREALGLIVPLCVELAELHRQGQSLHVHPSSLRLLGGMLAVAPDLSQALPPNPHDLACLSPESRHGTRGGSRASIYSIGAILYELITGKSVGPGMLRPSEVVQGLPAALELILSKALVADPTHRPDDLNALAQALHELAPKHSMTPPPADVTHLDHDNNLDVDVSLSMLPPIPKTPKAVGSSPFEMQVQVQEPIRAARPRMDDASNELLSLKARLEADQRPRYVIAKDGMDHGPFSAVELLQQIATHTFVEEDILRDTLGGDERTIKDWEEFAPFADHARRHRDIKAEKEAIQRVVVQEGRSTRSKAFLGVAALAALLVAAGAWFLTARGQKNDSIIVQEASQSSVETNEGLTGKKTGSGKRGRVVGSQGGIPILGGGMSCEGAQAAYVEEMSIGGPKGQADLTAGQYGSILNSGSYFSHCGIPDSMKLSICAAVQNGRAVGVSITTSPRDAGKSSCVASAVRRLSFPSHPKLDVTRTSF